MGGVLDAKGKGRGDERASERESERERERARERASERRPLKEGTKWGTQKGCASANQRAEGTQSQRGHAIPERAPNGRGHRKPNKLAAERKTVKPPIRNFKCKTALHPSCHPHLAPYAPPRLLGPLRPKLPRPPWYRYHHSHHSTGDTESQSRLSSP